MSIYLSVYSITNLHDSIQECQIFCTKNKASRLLFSWALPIPGFWNKFGVFGNTIDADGIGLGTVAPFHGVLPQAFLMILQILCQPLSVEDGELSNHLVPVAVALGPFLCHILACQIEHLFQRAVTGKYAFCFCHFPVLAVQSFYNIGGIYYAPYFIGELEEGAGVFPVVLPVADGIGIFSPLFLPDVRQRAQACLLVRGVVH